MKLITTIFLLIAINTYAIDNRESLPLESINASEISLSFQNQITVNANNKILYMNTKINSCVLHFDKKLETKSIIQKNRTITIKRLEIDKWFDSHNPYSEKTGVRIYTESMNKLKYIYCYIKRDTYRNPATLADLLEVLEVSFKTILGNEIITFL